MLPVGKYTIYILVFLYPPSYHQGHVTTLAVTTLSLITAIVQTPIVREMKRKMEERRKRKRREREKERKRSRVVNPCFHLSGVQKFV